MPVPLSVPIPVTGRNPVPVSEAVSGLVRVLLITLTLALRTPCKRGVKVMLILQLALTPKVGPQVVLRLKSVWLAPVTVMEEIAILEAPVFVRTIVTGEEDNSNLIPGNVTAGGIRLAMGPPSPVPVKGAVLGVLVALLTTLSEADLAPAETGVKVMLILHPSPAPKVAPQVVVLLKSPELAPVIVIEEIAIVAPPVFVRVTVTGELELPTDMEPKATDVGERLPVGAVPVPVRGALSGLVEALVVKVRLALRAPKAFGVKVTPTIQLLP